MIKYRNLVTFNEFIYNQAIGLMIRVFGRPGFNP